MLYYLCTSSTFHPFWVPIKLVHHKDLNSLAHALVQAILPLASSILHVLLDSFDNVVFVATQHLEQDLSDVVYPSTVATPLVTPLEIHRQILSKLASLLPEFQSLHFSLAQSTKTLQAPPLLPSQTPSKITKF